MQCPLITIVIPSLNQADYLDECLESIFNQNIQKEVYTSFLFLCVFLHNL